MGNCRHFRNCGLTDEGDPENHLCILHYQNQKKEWNEFYAALETHRKRSSDFSLFFFPGETDFFEAEFDQDASFFGATFNGEAMFHLAKFHGRATFEKATFGGEAGFGGANFEKTASFDEVTFRGEAHVHDATFGDGAGFSSVKFTTANFISSAFKGGVHFGLSNFGGEVDFSWATFGKSVEFLRSTFSGETSFVGTRFAEEGASFRFSSFRARARFASGEMDGEHIRMFSRLDVDFRDVAVEPPGAVTFVEADLRRCRFLGTNLEYLRFTGVKWPRTSDGRRDALHDEIVSGKNDQSGSLAQIEDLYRQVKKSYEGQRDYERASDFHYGEKEMRRRNPGTRKGLRALLWLYRNLSGYGEEYLRPLVWSFILLAVSAAGYLYFGLQVQDGKTTLAFQQLKAWSTDSLWVLGKGLFYSFRVMTLLRPDDLEPLRWGQLIHAGQSLLGPLLLGLAGIAIRQRLRR